MVWQAFLLCAEKRKLVETLVSKKLEIVRLQNVNQKFEQRLKLVLQIKFALVCKTVLVRKSNCRMESESEIKLNSSLGFDCSFDQVCFGV